MGKKTHTTHKWKLSYSLPINNIIYYTMFSSVVTWSYTRHTSMCPQCILEYNFSINFHSVGKNTIYSPILFRFIWSKYSSEINRVTQTFFYEVGGGVRILFIISISVRMQITPLLGKRKSCGENIVLFRFVSGPWKSSSRRFSVFSYEWNVCAYTELYLLYNNRLTLLTHHNIHFSY